MRHRLTAMLRRLNRHEGDRPTALVPYRRGEVPPDPPAGHDALYVEEVVVQRNEAGDLIDCNGQVVRVDRRGRIVPPEC